jgi:hypothetical protein
MFVINGTLIVLMSDPNKLSQGVASSQLCDIFNKLLSHGGTTEVAVVMSDPSFLMSARDTWTKSSSISSRAADTGVKLTGAHEIKHGAYSAPVKQVSPENSDKILEALLTSMFSWLGSNLYNRKLSLISSNWKQGYNFVLSSPSGSKIEHSNLLRTSLCSIADLDAGEMDNFEVVRRIRASCPVGIELAITEGHLNDRVLSKLSAILPEKPYYFIDIPNNPLISNAHNGKPLSILHGPTISYLSDSEMHCEIEVEGYGAVTFHLYELPPSTNYADAKSFIFYNRSKLHLIRRIDRRCISSKNMIFKLSNLEPYTTFCAAIDLSGKDNRTSVVHFRTFPWKDSLSSSMTIVPIFERDLCFPSYRISKAVELLDGYYKYITTAVSNNKLKFHSSILNIGPIFQCLYLYLDPNLLILFIPCLEMPQIVSQSWI